jgi:hypothetical protein
MPKGRTKGALDKRPRKARGARHGLRDAVTEVPTFSSSHNRRGSITAMQRSFGAFFTGEVNQPTVSLSNSKEETGTEPDTLMNVASPHIITSEDNHVTVSLHEDPKDITGTENHVTRALNANYDDSESEHEDEDRRPREFCPELEKALAVVLDMRLRKHEIKERLRKSHFLEHEVGHNEDWFNGKLKLCVRCCAPHLQYSDVQYTCVACNGQDTRLDGWAHGPRYPLLPRVFSCAYLLLHATSSPYCPQMAYYTNRARFMLDVDEPYLLCSYTYQCKDPSCGRKTMCSDPRSLAFLGYDRVSQYDFILTTKSGISRRLLTSLEWAITGGMSFSGRP